MAYKSQTTPTWGQKQLILILYYYLLLRLFVVHHRISLRRQLMSQLFFLIIYFFGGIGESREHLHNKKPGVGKIVGSTQQSPSKRRG